MQFTATRPFNGDTERAFGLAEPALTALGFRMNERTKTTLEMSGPGMHNSRQSGLVGASRIQMVRSRTDLELTAELGGVTRMARFVTWFPLGLCVGLGIVLSVVFALTAGPGIWIYIVAAVVGGNALIWCIIGPIMIRVVRNRTTEALDTLLDNMVRVGTV